MVKNPPANAGDVTKRPGFDPWVWKILWRGGRTIHSSIHAWRIPRTEEPGRLRFTVSQRVRHKGSNIA